MSTIKKLHAQPKSIRGFARHLYECGQLSVEEFVLDLARGRPFDETVQDFARLDPKIVAALVAVAAEAGHC